MADIILIDQITTQDGADTYNTHYVRLSVNEESEVDFGVFEPISLTIEEGFGKANVMCKIVINDTFGALVNAKTIEGSDTFTLYIGKSPESFQSYKMKMKSCKIYNQSSSESANYHTELVLISDHWQSMSHDRIPRAWKNVKHSDVVSEILDECGIDLRFVSDTKNSQRTLIRPYWTNVEMLNWIANRSQGNNGDSFFVYAALADDMFFFSTFSDLIEDNVQSLLNFDPEDPRIFTLSGSSIFEGDQERRRLTHFRIESNYVDELSQGASGINYGYYDYDTRSYVKGSHKYSESDEIQLSDWGMVSEDQETGGMFYFGHRDKSATENIVKSTVSKETNKILNVITSTQGTTDVQVGEVVRLLIPVSPEYFNVQFNEFYSGRYVVSFKKTMCNLQNSTAETVFRFTRQGINSPVPNTLTQSQRGKL